MRDSLKDESKCLAFWFQPHLIHVVYVRLNPSVVSDSGELGHNEMIIFDGRVKPCIHDVLHNLLEAGLVGMAEFVPGGFFLLEQPSHVRANDAWWWCTRSKCSLVYFQRKRVVPHAVNGREVLSVNPGVLGKRSFGAPLQRRLLLRLRLELNNTLDRQLIILETESSWCILSLWGECREGGGKIAAALNRKVEGDGNGLRSSRSGDKA